MSDFDTDLKNCFLAEATESVADLELCILELEKNSESHQQIDQLFRIIHNLKGSSNAAGFNQFGAFVHELESLVANIKKGQLKITPEIIRLLFKANDGLSKALISYKIDFNSYFDFGEITRDEEFIKESQVLVSKTSEVDSFSENVFYPPFRTVGGVGAKLTSKGTIDSDDLIRVPITKVEKLINYVGEMVIIQSVLEEISFTSPNLELKKSINMLKKVSQEIQDISMDLRMTPIKSTFQRMTRIVRDTSALLGKNVQLNVVGEETKLDKTVLDKLTDPLTHLVRNSIDHGIESASERIQLGKPEVGRIDLKAYHQSGRLIIEVLDDGAGLNAQKLIQKGIEKGILESGANLSDEQAYELIFKPGFSTKNEVTEISGRGVGMDVVRTNFLELGGEIDIETKIGIGTLFRVTLPLTLAIIESLVVTYSGHKFVIPLAHISETLSGKDYPVQKATGLGPLINLRNENIKLFRLGDFFGIASQKPPEEMIIVIVRSGSEPFALMIDDIVVKMPVVVKQLTPDLAGLPAVSGTTILGDGHPALILELTDLPKRKIISGYRPSQMKSEVRTAI